MPAILHSSRATTVAQPPGLGGRASAPAQRCLSLCSSSSALTQPCCSPQSRSCWRQSSVRQARPAGRLQVVAAESASTHNPPPVSVTKRKFYDSYRRPMNAIYNTVIQELLVQQHIVRYNRKYQYDEVFALGFCSVFDQVLEGVPKDRAEIFTAYVKALDEDPEKYRSDASSLEKWAGGISNPEDLHPSSGGDDIRQRLAAVAQNAKDGKFLYTRFFAIGLFRLLELSKAKDPAALQALVKAMNIEQDAVNRDLMTYKGILSKLSAAKELMQEYISREKKKQKERDEAKAAASKAKETADEPAKEPAGAPAKA